MDERLAVDIGGTFVDAIRFDRKSGDVELGKTPTTEADPEEGVLTAVEKVDADVTNVDTFTHGTTLGLNALLEQNGARTGIVTTEGFRDVFEIGRYNLPESEMYNIHYQKPDLLVPRRRRLGVKERIDDTGDVVTPLNEGQVRSAARELVEEHDVESIAVCFLNSYQNAEHERGAVDIIEDEFSNISVSASTDITREYREYERTSTAVLDAYIKPIFETYIDRLDRELADGGFDGSFLITRSGGGAFGVESAKQSPIHTVFSGPAGGLIGTAAVGDATDRGSLIAVDMGGTSLDTCVVQDGTPSVTYETELEHHPLQIPVYDIRTIGAGGGSIAWTDEGLLRVGPDSAGSDPGPICYGRGGTRPTVTDAALALGYIDSENFLGGEMEISEQAALDGIERKLADPLDSTVESTSKAVFDVMLANTVSAIREITVEKGLDPREFSMVAYGGAGPMFVPLVGRELDVNEIVIPQAPSAFSAWGMLMSDVVHDFSQTFIELLDDTSVENLNAIFDDLTQQGVEKLHSEGFNRDAQQHDRSLGMRYFGQEHSVEVRMSGIETIDELESGFETKHEDRYGHTMDDPVEIVNLRVRSTGVSDKPQIEAFDDPATDEGPSSRSAYCFATGERTDFDVYRRSALSTGASVSGPAIVQEPTTTIVFYADQTATVDEYGHLIITNTGEDA
jgi:N-methylhydantoinase A